MAAEHDDRVQIIAEKCEHELKSVEKTHRSKRKRGNLLQEIGQKNATIKLKMESATMRYPSSKP